MKKVKFSIYSKLLILILTLSLLPMTIWGGISYYRSRQVLEEHIGHKLEELSRLATQAVEQEIANLFQEIQEWAELGVMQNVLTLDAEGQIATTLADFQKRYPSYHQLICLTPKGNIVASSKPQSTEGIDETKWFKQAVSGKVYVGEVEYIDESNNLGIILASPIRATENPEQVIGVIAGTFNWKHIYPLLEAIKINTEEGEKPQDVNAHIMLTNRDGLIIFAPEFERNEGVILKKNMFGEKLTLADVNKHSGHLISIDEHVTRALIGYHHSHGHKGYPGTGQISIALQAIDEAFAPITTLRDFLIFNCVMLIMIVITVANLFAKTLTNPIKQLTAATGKIAQRDNHFYIGMPEALQVNTGDELDELAQSFNHMCQALQERDQKLNTSYQELENANEELHIITKELEYTLLEIKKTVQLAIEEKNLSVRFSNPALEKCWEVKKCHKPKCPAYESTDRRCWQIDGTLCTDDTGSSYSEKIAYCKECEVCKWGTASKYYAIGELFNELLKLLEEQQCELQDYAQNLEVKVTDRTAELEHSNRELQQFAYIASHDLQEPLRKIRNYTELLAQRYEGKLDTKADKYIAYAVDGATRMQELINNLLQYSRAGSKELSLEEINMENIVKQAISNLETSIKENKAKITYDTLPTVMVSKLYFTQLLQNLIGNAIKFHDDSPPKIHLLAERQNGNWVFEIHDNGIGIAKKYLEQIFVIFQRLHTKTEYDGTGIGLAICKKIVQRHNGHIWVESKLGKGTTFYFTVPINTED